MGLPIKIPRDPELIRGGREWEADQFNGGCTCIVGHDMFNCLRIEHLHLYH